MTASLTLQINLREHKFYSAYDPEVTFTKTGANEIQAYSSQDGAGRAYFFVVFSKVWLNGKAIRIDWANNSMADVVAEALLYDGEYNRADDTDFPTGAEKATKGNGLLSTLRTHVGSFDEDWTSGIIDTSGAFCSKVTLFLQITDAWAGVQFSEFYLRLMQVLDGLTVVRDETCGSPVVMEKTGTFGDFGYVSVDYWDPPLVYLEDTAGRHYASIDEAVPIPVNFGDVTRGIEYIFPLYLQNESSYSGKNFRNCIVSVISGGTSQKGSSADTYEACGLCLSEDGPWTSSLYIGLIPAQGLSGERKLFYIRYVVPAGAESGTKRWYIKFTGSYLWDNYEIDIPITIPPFINEIVIGILSNVATIPRFISEASLGRLPELGIASAYATAEGTATAAKLGYATASPTPVALGRLPKLGTVPAFIDELGLGRLPSKGEAFPMVTLGEASGRLPNLAIVPQPINETAQARLPDALIAFSAMAGLPSYSTRAVPPDALKAQNVGLSVADAYIAWIGKTLPASFTIIRESFNNLSANFLLRRSGSKSISASFFISLPYADLSASLIVRRAHYADLPASISPETQILVSEDSYVSEEAPNTNYNSSPILMVANEGTGKNYWAFLKFNLSEITAGQAIIKARLGLTVETRANIAVVNRLNDVPDDSWNESTITWNNMPVYGNEILTWWPYAETDEQRYFVTNNTLTGLIQKAYESTSKVMSLAIRRTDNDYNLTSRYYSKTSNPQVRWATLFLTFGSAGAADLSGSFQVNHP